MQRAKSFCTSWETLTTIVKAFAVTILQWYLGPNPWSESLLKIVKKKENPFSSRKDYVEMCLGSLYALQVKQSKTCFERLIFPSWWQKTSPNTCSLCHTSVLFGGEIDKKSCLRSTFPGFKAPAWVWWAGINAYVHEDSQISHYCPVQALGTAAGLKHRTPAWVLAPCLSIPGLTPLPSPPGKLTL